MTWMQLFLWVVIFATLVVVAYAIDIAIDGIMYKIKLRRNKASARRPGLMEVTKIDR